MDCFFQNTDSEEAKIVLVAEAVEPASPVRAKLGPGN